jgi:hypothetical protein
VFHDGLMQATGRLAEDAVIQIAREAGVDVDRMRADMEDPAINKSIDGNIELAQAGKQLTRCIVGQPASHQALKRVGCTTPPRCRECAPLTPWAESSPALRPTASRRASGRPRPILLQPARAARGAGGTACCSGDL